MEIEPPVRTAENAVSPHIVELGGADGVDADRNAGIPDGLCDFVHIIEWFFGEKYSSNFR